MNLIRTYIIFSFSFILAAAAISGCGGKTASEDEAVVEGTIKNFQGNRLLLQGFSAEGLNVLDTAELDKNGNFKFRTYLREQQLVFIQANQRFNIFFVLDPKGKVNIQADAQAEYDYTISGSEPSTEIHQLVQDNRNFAAKIQNLQEMAMQKQNRNPGGQAFFQKMAQQVMDSASANATKAALGTENPFVHLYITEILRAQLPDSVLDLIAPSISSIQNNAVATAFTNRFNAEKKLRMGEIAPDFVVPTPDDKSISLADFKGKVVLVDFWASWCRPCRLENPNLVNAYAQFKGKGFDIFGVSLDEDRDAWLKAIEVDKLTWRQGSDLGGWGAAPARLYNISSIPQNLLLDKEGRIIAKNLRGEDLLEKLKEIFGNI